MASVKVSKRATIVDEGIIEKLRRRYGNKCYICGAKDGPLHVHHVVPLGEGGNNKIENLRLVCPNCHVRIHNPRENEIRGFDFENYLFQLLQLNKKFRNVRLQNGPMEIGVDITAEEMIGDKWQQVFIECKASSAFTKNRWSVVLQQLKFTKERMRHGKLVFAFLGEANAEMVRLFKGCNIEVWDFEYIARRFRQEIPKVYHPLLQAIFLAAKAPMSKSPEMQLIRNLESLKPGNADWSNYQKIIGQILERLFCPPLLTPISELSDSSKVNRRDFIVPNYSEDGFWRFIRSRYNAEYIVVDAKNYSGKIKKHSVLQISNYLKRQGAGLFGIIICRKGGDFSCSQTVREIWAIERKLVVILTDDDVTRMLTEKAFGRNPEVVIRQKIEDFRLSL